MESLQRAMDGAADTQEVGKATPALLAPLQAAVQEVLLAQAATQEAVRALPSGALQPPVPGSAIEALLKNIRTMEDDMRQRLDALTAMLVSVRNAPPNLNGSGKCSLGSLLIVMLM